MLDACLDLLLGSSCVVCGASGRLLCRLCEDDLPTRAAVCPPTPCPAGLAPPVATGEYDGALKVLVNAHKERGQFSLARPLGDLLATAVDALVTGRFDGAVEGAVEGAGDGAGDGAADGPVDDRPWLLVPVPSRRAVVRARGHDPMLRVTRHAATALRRRGRRVGVAALLRSVGAARDQTGLQAGERAVNLAGSMTARRMGAPGRAGLGGVRLVVTDDVLTTGSTAREAQRALEAAGGAVHGIATVAATRRRRRPVTGPKGSVASLPFSDPDD